MQLSKSVEMYLETIYLLQQDHGHAHVNEIARQLGISKPSVTKAMDRLKEGGYINKETYGHITLTQQGSTLSKDVFGRHTAIAAFLQCSLGLNSDDASTNACKMEHIITPAMLKAIKTYLQKQDKK